MSGNKFFSQRAMSVFGFCALGLATSTVVKADDLIYTLTNVVFNDGATATGLFDFNTTTQTFSTFDITTTNGVGDRLFGSHYTPATNTPFSFSPSKDFYFQNPSYALALATNTPANTPGVYALTPGTFFHPGFSNSGEFAPSSSGGYGARVITGGSLTVTSAAVPELSTLLGFGSFVALGGLAAFRSRERSASRQRKQVRKAA